jgi:hypothetical protein
MSQHPFLIVLVLACAISTPALAIEAPLTTHDEFVQRTQLKLERLEPLIRAHQEIVKIFLNQESHLKETYGNVEFTNVYQGINLTTMEGIHNVRRRLKNLNARSEAFAAAQKQFRTSWEDRARNADVDEPLLSELNVYFSTGELNLVANYQAWYDAMRENSAAIARLLDTAQKTLADAEHAYDITGRAALDHHDPTQNMIKAALDEIGYAVHHRDGT